MFLFCTKLHKVTLVKNGWPLKVNGEDHKKDLYFEMLLFSEKGHKVTLTHRDEYRRALFVSVFQRVFCVHTQAIFADEEPSEHANSFPDIRWRLM